MTGSLLGLGLGSVLLAGAIAAPALAKTYVYVSNAVDGDIGVYAMDGGGALAPMARVPAGKVVMPMAVSPDKRHLYAVVRSDPPRVLTYAIDAASGGLKQVAEAPLPDSMPNVTTDRAGRFLLTASYSGDKLAVNPIDADGRVTQPAKQVLPTGHNAHSIQPDRTNRFVYASNLGSDQVVQFRFDPDTGTLTPNDPPAFKTPEGDGPRHMIFSADNKYLYVLHEMAGTVAQLAIDPKTGTLSAVDTVASVPPDSGLQKGKPQAPITPATMAAGPQNATPTEKPSIWAADIQMSPDGRFVYTTERTSSRLALFSVDAASGKLTYVANFATVTQPRGIKIDPAGRYLVASGEKSPEVAVYRIDPASGRLGEVGRYPGGTGANWVEIVDLP